MASIYSKEVRARVVQQALMPGAPTLIELSRRTGVSKSAIGQWVQRARAEARGETQMKQESRPEGRSAEDKLRVALGSEGLTATEPSAYLRREGVHGADLQRWRSAALEGLSGGGLTAGRERAQAAGACARA